MSEIDNNISELISKDELPFEVNDSIQQQLNYHMQLKNASSRVKQNSILPLFGGLLTTKLLGVKISVVAVAMFAFVGYNEMKSPSSVYPLADTVSISKSIDSIGSFSVDDSLMVD